MAVNLSASFKIRAVLPGHILFPSLVLVPVLGCVNPKGLVRLEGFGESIKVIHLIGYRTRDLLACSVMINYYTTAFHIRQVLRI
jgi:hypothetical protein